MTGTPRSWYPVCLSRELKRGAIRPIRVGSRDWILFRKQDNALGVVSRFCGHMGADLARGKVVGECVQCPLHAWQFGADGICVHIPVAEKIPEKSRLASLPVCEVFGIVLVFNGPLALFDVPLRNRYDGMPHSTPKRRHGEFPFQAVSLNTFDMQHFRHVHSREIVSEPELLELGPFGLGVKFDAKVLPVRWVDRLLLAIGLGSMAIHLECHGGNLLTLWNSTTRIHALFCMMPVSDGMQLYLVTVADYKSKSMIGRFLQFVKLQFAERMIEAFLKPDMVALGNIQVKAGALLPDADRIVRKFWRFWKALPKAGEEHEAD